MFEAECIVGIARVGTPRAFVLFEGRKKLVPLGLVGEGRRGGHGRGLGGRFGGQRGSGIGKGPRLGGRQSPVVPMRPVRPVPGAAVPMQVGQFARGIGGYLISQQSYKEWKDS